MEFIRLVSKASQYDTSDGDAVYININKIIFFYAVGDGSIIKLDPDGMTIYVLESPESIANLINQKKACNGSCNHAKA